MIREGLLALLAIFHASAAEATGMIVAGNGYAQRCYEAAEKGNSLRDSLRGCDAALRGEALSTSDRAATLVNRGIIQMRWQKMAAALADFDAAITLRPDTAEAYVNKGIALMRMGGRDDEAVALLSEGIARNPLRPAIAYYQRAVANEGLGRVREAYEDYSRAAELDPEWADPAEQLQRFQTVRRKTANG